MTPAQLHRAVATATGDSPRTIRRLGFSLVDWADPAHEPVSGGPLRFLDWDRVSRRRYRRLAIH
jgi:hypothetical protein